MRCAFCGQWYVEGHAVDCPARWGWGEEWELQFPRRRRGNPPIRGSARSETRGWQSARLEAYRERQRAAGLVSERFPEVESIRLETVFHDTDGRPIQRRIKEVYGDDFALFELPCPIEGCTVSLDEIIQQAIAKHGRRRTGAIMCSGENKETGVTMPPHRMDYTITIRYRAASG